MDPVDDRQRLAHGTAQPPGHPEQVGVEAAWQRDRRDQLERVTGLRHHPGLEAAGRAQAGDLDAGLEADQGVGSGQERGGVAGGSTTGEQDAHRTRD